MLYKNVSGTHVQLQEHRFLQPNSTVDLSEEELRNPNIRSMINQKGWLTPILQEAVTGLVTNEVNNITGQHPGQNVTNDYNFNVTFPIGHEMAQADADRQKIINAAIEDGKAHKLSDNLPIENASEIDYVVNPKYVDGTKEYGNSELNNEQGNPITHDGMITPLVYGEKPVSIQEVLTNPKNALPAVEQYVHEDNKVHAAVTDDIDYSEKALDDKPIPTNPPVDKPANSKKPISKKKD